MITIFVLLQSELLLRQYADLASLFLDDADRFWHVYSGYTLQIDSDFTSRLYLSLLKELGVNREILQVSFVLSVLLCCVLALVAQLFSRDMVQETEKKSSYECGFFPFDSATRLPFDVHFYVVGIMFLVFDVELIILTTIIILAATMPGTALACVAGFVIVLTVGFVYEWTCGALRWESKIPEPMQSMPTSSAWLIFLLLLPSDFGISPAGLIFKFAFVDIPVLQTTFLLYTLSVIAAFPLSKKRRSALRRRYSAAAIRRRWGIAAWRQMFADWEKSVRLYFRKPTPFVAPAVYTWRRRSDPFLLSSWRPRFWRRRKRVHQPIEGVRSWAKKKFHTLFDDILYVATPQYSYHANCGRLKRLWLFIRTRTIPTLHFHVARIHRWPLVIAVSMFAVPFVCVPVPWFLDDYDVAWDDLIELYKTVHRGVVKQSYLLRDHSLLSHIVTVLFLYPAAMLNVLCTDRWPLMFFVGLAVARCWYLYGSSSLSLYRRFRSVRRLRRWSRIVYRRSLAEVYDLYLDSQAQVRPHPDRGREDEYSRPRFRNPRRQHSRKWPLFLFVFVPMTNFLDFSVVLLDLVGDGSVIRALRRLCYDIKHDFFALCWTINTYSRAVALLLLICGVIYGITGLFLTPLRLMMPPKVEGFILPPIISIVVLYLSLRGLSSWWEFNTFPRGRMWYIGWTTGVKTKSWWWVISRPGYILLLLTWAFVRPLRKRVAARYWSGRQEATIMRVRHRRNIRNRRFARRVLAAGYAQVILPSTDFATKLSAPVENPKPVKPSPASAGGDLNK